MNPACACGSPRTVRHGAETGSHLRLAGEVAERVGATFPRFLCKGCGRTFSHRPPEVEQAERLVRERASDLAFALGRAPAARVLGIGPSVLATLLDRWQAAREADMLDASSDFLILESVGLRGAEAILVADVDRESLVEVTAGIERLEGWLARPGSLPALRVCVPLDPALAGVVRRSLPEAELMVAPGAVARSLRGALAAGLRILRRLPGMRGRNAFPSTARFLRAVEGASAACEGWPREVVALHGAGRVAGEIAGAADAESGKALWPEFELTVAVPGGSPLARLMSTWKGAILSGLEHRFVDRIARTVEQVRRLTQARRPSLVFQDFRGLVLLRDYEHRAAPPVAPGAGRGTVAFGRPLEGLVGLLRASAGMVPSTA